MLLLLDNYDSFTFNLFQYLRELGEDVLVVRNDQITVEDCLEMDPDRIVISPGPCTPKEAGVSVELVRAFAGVRPILGVCLGHQSIAEAFGASVESAGEIMHGKTSRVQHDGAGVFAGIPSDFSAIRYHSLGVNSASLPPDLVISATSESGVIMGLRHSEYAIEGVQFHPESIVTEYGYELLQNFLDFQSATWL